MVISMGDSLEPQATVTEQSKWKLAAAIAFLVVSVAFMVNSANEYFVNTNLLAALSSSSNSGTVNCDTDNLSIELAKAAPGSVINVVGDCTNQGKILISKSGTSDNPIVINGGGAVIGVANHGGLTWNGAGAKVKGFSLYVPGSPLGTVNYVTISGFEITGTRFDANPTGAGILAYGLGNVFSGNYVHDLPQVGISIYSNSSANTIKNNLIRNVGLYGGMVVSGEGNLISGNDISSIRQYPPDSVTPPTSVQCCCGDPATYAGIGCETTCSAAGYDADGIKLSGNNHQIFGNYIHDISLSDPYNYAPHIDAIQTSGAVSGLIIEKNIIDLPKEYTLRNGKKCVFSGSKIFTSDIASNITFKNNLFSNYGGIQVASPSGLKILNNDFINLTYRAFEISPCADCQIKNNIFYEVGKDASISGNFSDSGLTGILENNFFYSTTGKVGTTSPLFVNFNYNLAQGDFTPSPSSACLNAGLAISDVSDDFLGVSRPQGSGYDIGAFESSQVTSAQSCVENWSCGDWGACSDSTQTRACTDTNSCGTSVGKPAVNQSCTVSNNHAPAISSISSYRVGSRTFRLTAKTSDLDSDVLTYSWSFGDGAEGVGNPVTHKFPSSFKAYTVTLIVSDGKLTATKIKSVIPY